MENCLSCVESDRRRTQRGQDAWRARRGGRESWSSLALWCLGRGVYAASTRPSLLAFLGRAKLPSPPPPPSRCWLMGSLPQRQGPSPS